MTKQIIISLIFSGLICGCNFNHNEVQKSTYELDSLDYVLISTAIEQYFFHPKTLSHRFHHSVDSLGELVHHISRDEVNMFLVLDSTIQFEDSISIYTHITHKQVDNTDSLLTEKIVNINHKRYKIDPKRISSFNIQTISESEINLLLDSILYYGYNKLYDKYPDAYGILYISKPAFNDNYDKAIIYLSIAKDPEWGQGNYLWLKKVGDKWVAYDIVFLWES